MDRGGPLFGLGRRRPVIACWITNWGERVEKEHGPRRVALCVTVCRTAAVGLFWLARWDGLRGRTRTRSAQEVRKKPRAIVGSKEDEKRRKKKKKMKQAAKPKRLSTIGRRKPVELRGELGNHQEKKRIEKKPTEPPAQKATREREREKKKLTPAGLRKMRLAQVLTLASLVVSWNRQKKMKKKTVCVCGGVNSLSPEKGLLYAHSHWLLFFILLLYYLFFLPGRVASRTNLPRTTFTLEPQPRPGSPVISFFYIFLYSLCPLLLCVLFFHSLKVWSRSDTRRHWRPITIICCPWPQKQLCTMWLAEILPSLNP